MNSIVFIVNTNRICNQMIIRWCHLARKHIAKIISPKPIRTVIGLATVSPKIRETISWCLGTKLQILQYTPLIIQTEATKK
ncbi:hypothetical protein O4O04_16395 [Leptospira sp. GIMC2001]|nr:hypothetical protein [Leptospira sp. GIMC2001]WCL48865.1 hypothetical protein O4O04_16395 [Leptospira sp. GIMC2001]